MIGRNGALAPLLALLALLALTNGCDRDGPCTHFDEAGRCIARDPAEDAGGEPDATRDDALGDGGAARPDGEIRPDASAAHTPPAVDLLLVIDNSGSMASEQRKLEA